MKTLGKQENPRITKLFIWSPLTEGTEVENRKQENSVVSNIQLDRFFIAPRVLRIARHNCRKISA
jgi:hypothetical protein